MPDNQGLPENPGTTVPILAPDPSTQTDSQIMQNINSLAEEVGVLVCSSYRLSHSDLLSLVAKLELALKDARELLVRRSG